MKSGEKNIIVKDPNKKEANLYKRFFYFPKLNF